MGVRVRESFVSASAPMPILVSPSPASAVAVDADAATVHGDAPVTVTTLYREHHAWLGQWLRRRLSGAEQAADLAHDTFVRLIVSGRLPARSRSRAYLVQIAQGLVIDQYRRRQIENAWLETLAAQPTATAPSPEARLIIIETLMRLAATLDALPARVRDIFLKSQLDGLTYREIAAEFAVSVGTVRKAMLKATVACVDTMDSLDR